METDLHSQRLTINHHLKNAARGKKWLASTCTHTGAHCFFEQVHSLKPRNPAVTLGIMLSYLRHGDTATATAGCWCTASHCSTTTSANLADHRVRSILSNHIRRMDPLLNHSQKELVYTFLCLYHITLYIYIYVYVLYMCMVCLP